MNPKKELLWSPWVFPKGKPAEQRPEGVLESEVIIIYSLKY